MGWIRADQLEGGPGADLIDAFDGDDLIFGGAGNDDILGGGGAAAERFAGPLSLSGFWSRAEAGCQAFRKRRSLLSG